MVEAVAHQVAAAGRRQFHYESTRHQSIDDRLQGRQILDGLHACGASAQVAECLLAAQQQFAQHRQLDARDAEPVVGAVLVLDCTPHPVDLGHRLHQAQLIERLLDIDVVVRREGLAIVLLVAPRDDRVDRHGVAGGRGLGLLDEDAQHTALVGFERLP